MSVLMPRKCWLRQATEGDIDAVLQMEMALYDPNEINHVAGTELKEWYRAYPDGGWVVTTGDTREIVGAFGVWPLADDAYRRMIGGQLHESQLGLSDLQENVGSDGARHRSWYIGAIEIHNKITSRLKHRQIKTQLLRAALTWLDRPEVADHIRVTAIGSTASGVRIAKRFGLQEQQNIGVFAIEASKADLRGKVEKVLDHMDIQSWVDATALFLLLLVVYVVHKQYVAILNTPWLAVSILFVSAFLFRLFSRYIPKSEAARRVMALLRGEP